MKHLILIAALAAGCLFLGTPVPSLAQSSAGCSGFTGRWATTWPGGTTKVRIVGRKGVYSYRGGILTGQIAGTVFSGTYAENDGETGTFRFALSDDGNSFSGWFATSEDPATHQYWNGICTGSATSS